MRMISSLYLQLYQCVFPHTGLILNVLSFYLCVYAIEIFNFIPRQVYRKGLLNVEL